MYIDKLLLKNYRNLKNININFNNGINIFYGDNAQGKTNVLEALYFCSSGRSHRTKTEKELINFNKEDAHIQLYYINNDNKNKIDVHLKKNFKKGIAINNIPIKKIGELFGKLYVVIFSPEDMQIIKLGPSERRKFIDLELCQISNIYYYNLKQYYKILKQRNNLLKSIQRNNLLKNTIFVWDEQLISYGLKIIEYRSKFINLLNEITNRIHSNITGEKEKLTIYYKSNVVKDDYIKKLSNNIEKDIIYGSTSYGPHKDDIIFMINNVELKNYGPQGQQRTAILSLKLAEIEIIKLEKKINPILLLDDVLSELDETRQNFLINSINDIQTFITCTGIEETIRKFNQKPYFYVVKNGIITVKNFKFVV